MSLERDPRGARPTLPGFAMPPAAGSQIASVPVASSPAPWAGGPSSSNRVESQLLIPLKQYHL
jgi:hypothetical protein